MLTVNQRPGLGEQEHALVGPTTQTGFEHLTSSLACLPRRIERAQELEDAGEYMQAMKLWRAAYKICPQLEEPTWKSNGACA